MYVVVTFMYVYNIVVIFQIRGSLKLRNNWVEDLNRY